MSDDPKTNDASGPDDEAPAKDKATSKPAPRPRRAPAGEGRPSLLRAFGFGGRRSAETDKKPYSAGGMDELAAARFIDQCEVKASGSIGHPWPGALKHRMHAAINGVSEIPDIKRRILDLQLQYEKALTAIGDEIADGEA